MVTSRQGLKAGFWIVFGLVLVGSLVVLHRIYQLREDARSVVHTREAREALQMTLIGLIDAETGERGFLLSGDRRFLDPYQDGRVKTPGNLRHLREKVGDNPRQEQRLGRLEERVRAEFALMAEMVEMKERDPKSGRWTTRLGQSKADMDTIRGLVAAMDREEQAMLSMRVDHFWSAFRVSLGAGILAAILGAVGTVVLLQLVLNSLNARDDYQREVERHRQWLQVTLHCIGDGLIATDLEGRVTFLNAVTEQMTGWSAKEAIGLPLERVFPIINEVTGKPTLNPLGRVLSEGAVLDLANHTALVHTSGRVTPIQDSAAPIRDSDGKVVGMVLVFSDVTQARQAAESLARSEARLRSLINLSPEAIWIHRDGRIELVNHQAVLLMGVESARDLIGRNIRDLIHPGSHGRMQARLEAVQAGQIVRLSEETVIRNDGQVRLVEISSVASEDSTGKVVQCVLRDVTERRRAEAEQARMREQMVHMQKLESLGVLVAGVAHNFNNLLAVILGYASMRGEVAPGGEDRIAYQAIIRAAERGRSLVTSMVNFGRPSLAAKVPLDLVLVSKEVKFLLVNATANRVVIAEDYPAEPAWVLGDAGSLGTVVMNLCINSLDAMPEGGTLTLRVGIPAPEWVELAVTDTGTGMSPEVAERATDPFFTTKPVGTGTGLGLSSALGVVQAHGGTLDLGSLQGQGTTVRVRLPRVARPARGEDPAAPAATAPLAGSLAHVLLVDDDKEVRELMGRMLVQGGVARVETACGGEEALALLAAGTPPDLVILDQNMPGMNGTRTLDQIRAKWPDLRVLIASGQPGIETQPEFKGRATATIGKPFTLRDLSAALARL